jgi:hypothetical protein
MRRDVLLSAVAGAVLGVVAAFAGMHLLGFSGTPQADGAGVRADLDALERRILRDAATDLAGRDAVLGRIAALERAVAASGSAADREEARAALAALAEDLRTLGAGLHADLRAADTRLGAVEGRVRDLEALSGAAAAATSGPLTEDEEAFWVTDARSPDPMRRFSALVKLGRTRSDRSVACATEALADPDERVAWQAVRNLGTFRERAAARDVAALLDHPASVLRLAAAQALATMGAPATSFDPAAAAPRRREAADALRRWAAEQTAE